MSFFPAAVLLVGVTTMSMAVASPFPLPQGALGYQTAGGYSQYPAGVGGTGSGYPGGYSQYPSGVRGGYPGGQGAGAGYQGAGGVGGYGQTPGIYNSYTGQGQSPYGSGQLAYNQNLRPGQTGYYGQGTLVGPSGQRVGGQGSASYAGLGAGEVGTLSAQNLYSG